MMEKRILSVVLALIIVVAASPAVFAGGGDEYVAAMQIGSGKIFDDELLIDAFSAIPAARIGSIDKLPARSAILVEQTTGKILFENNADEQMAPASITKIMTLLLVMEALEAGRIKLEDVVTCSEHASSMGGSQIWLEVGEQMTVDMLLKATAIASANDASVALAEHIAGSEDIFVEMMNERAKQLGMTNTHFVNATGLDAPGHLTTARDIVAMSRRLVEYEKIRDYSTIWMDSLRDGKSELVNTNKLIRFYDGMTGLKTGTTSSAGSCLSATAVRDDLSLVAVVLGSPSSDERFNSARFLLDYGFANYMALTPPAVDEMLTPVKVSMGVADYVQPGYELPGLVVLSKSDKDKVTQEITLVESLEAPVDAGQTIGTVVVSVNGEKSMEYPLIAMKSVPRMNFFRAAGMLFSSLMRLG